MTIKAFPRLSSRLFFSLRQLLINPLPELLPPLSVLEHQRDYPRRQFIAPSSKLLLTNFFEASALVGFVGLILLVAQARAGLWNLWAVIGGIVILAWMLQAIADAQNQPTKEHHGFSQIFGADQYQQEKAREIFLTTLTGTDILAIIYQEYRQKSWLPKALCHGLSLAALILLLVFLPRHYPVGLTIATLPVPVLIWIVLRFQLNSRLISQAIDKRYDLITGITFQNSEHWSVDQLDLWYIISGESDDPEDDAEEKKKSWWEMGIGCLYQVAFYGFFAVILLVLVGQFVPNPPGYALTAEPYLPIVLLLFSFLLATHKGIALYQEKEEALESLEKFDAIYRMFTLVEAGRE